MKVVGSFVHLTTLPKSEKSESQGVMFLELWNFLRPLGRRPQAPVGNIVGKTVYLCANLMVETGHLPSWPLIEIRRPCTSSSQTFSTVPAFPSERTTALPTSS